MTSEQKLQAGKTTSSSWVRRCLTGFAVCLVVIIVAIALWSIKELLTFVASQAAQFASVMRVVRPIILFAILLLWCPVFRWLQARSWVEAETANRALEIWPRLTIWTALFEVTVGQGLLVIGLLAMAGYWFFLRRMIEP